MSLSQLDTKLYHKISKISCRTYIFQRPLLRDLLMGELIFGGAYLQWKICFTNSIGLACSWKGNKKDWVTIPF